MKDRLFPTLLLLFAFGAALPAQDPPESAVRGAKVFQKTELISGLENPWEITWGPDGMLWVTERTGKRISRVDPATGEQRVAITLDEVFAPGGQDGLLGLALHPDLLKGRGADYVYVGYTYTDESEGPDPNIQAPNSPYQFLYGKIVRLTFDPATEKLSDPVDLVTGLPAGNDHNAGRLKFGPDGKLYYTIGDQGHNQLGNYCLAIEAQRLPTKQEMAQKDYAAYVGKTLRLNLDGSIPKDNPKLNGVRSHVWTYGHRNTQGIDFAPDGKLYGAEHGPKTDDEINILVRGANYGWPHVAGLQDDKAYQYARWAEASVPCPSLEFSDLELPPSVPRQTESDFDEPFIEPIATLFTVDSGHNFEDPACQGVNFICWPTVGISGVEYYEAGDSGIPGWDKVLLITALKRGSLYIAHLTPDGKAVDSPIERYFQTENRYRDTAVSPDGRTLYVAADAGGLAEAIGGGTTTDMENPGAILAFTYVRDGDQPIEPVKVTRERRSAPAGAATASGSVAGGQPPQFSPAQVAAGKTAYNASCAVCHGSTLTNGTFGTPLAGEYFDEKWSGKSVKAFYDKTLTMPPGAPNSLGPQVYADILAYIFSMNGMEPGHQSLPAEPAETADQTIP